MPDCPSGQRERTVNPPAHAYRSSNLLSGTTTTPTRFSCRGFCVVCMLVDSRGLTGVKGQKVCLARACRPGFHLVGLTNLPILSGCPSSAGSRNRRRCRSLRVHRSHCYRGGCFHDRPSVVPWKVLLGPMSDYQVPDPLPAGDEAQDCRL